MDYTKHSEFRGAGYVEGFGSNDFNAEKVVGTITKKDLIDEDFKTDGDILFLIHQRWSDFCTACQVSYEAMKSENKKVSWSGMFKLIMKSLGYLTKFGSSIKDGCKARIKFGIPEQEFDTFQENKSRNDNANPENLSNEALKNAKLHEGESYVKIIPNKLDTFDSIRVWLNTYRKKNLYIKGGIDGHAWGVDRQYILKRDNKYIFNDIKITGDDLIKAGLKIGEMYLIGPDSYGEESKNYRLAKSINGWRFWNRKQMNYNSYAYFTLDIPHSLAEILNEYAGKVVKGSGEKVYLIKNGKKRWIRDEETAWVNLISLWYELVEITDSDLDLIPEGEIMRFENAPKKLRNLINEIANSPIILQRFQKDYIKIEETILGLIIKIINKIFKKNA